MDDRDRNLEEAVDDLAETLETLRAELGDPPRGPLGAPRPPTPGEFLRFTESYTIPALVSLLETAIRVLEALAAAIRLSEGRPLEGPAPAGGRPEEDALAAVSRRTLRRLDDALAALGDAAAEGGPADPQLRRLVDDARDLGAEVEDRLEEATRTGTAPRSGPTRRTDPEPVNIEVQAGDEADRDDAAGDETAAAGVDVDRELDSIRRELDEEGSDPATDPGSGAGDVVADDRREGTDDGREDAADDTREGVDDRRGDTDEPDDGPAGGSETQNGS